MRRFWLKNNGRIWDLSSNDLSGTNANFMADPQGLGIKVKVESYEVERATFIENVKFESTEISGKIYFNGYEQFTAFAGFIGSAEIAEPLRLYYSTAEMKPDYDSIDEWYKLVLIKELKKGEIDIKSGKLICDVKFQAVSRWKKDRVMTLELSPFGQSLVYPYVYPYYYGGQNNVGVHIDNTGNLSTHCTVKVEAETDLPLFRIIRNGEVIEQARYNVYIRSGSYLVVDSDPANQEASLWTGTNREDVYYLGEKDYTYSNFLTIPSGESLFLFTARNNQFGKVTLSYSLQKDLV